MAHRTSNQQGISVATSHSGSARRIRQGRLLAPMAACRRDQPAKLRPVGRVSTIAHCLAGKVGVEACRKVNSGGKANSHIQIVFFCLVGGWGGGGVGRRGGGSVSCTSSRPPAPRSGSRHAAPTIKASRQQLRLAIVLVEPQANEDAWAIGWQERRGQQWEVIGDSRAAAGLLVEAHGPLPALAMQH